MLFRSARRMVRGVLFDLFHTLPGLESEYSNLPWTSDVLGIDRATWDRALTSNSRWRLVGEVRDARQIVETLARALQPTIADDLIDRAVVVRTERFLQALRSIPADNVRLLKELRQRGVRTALVSNADVMEVAGWQDSPLAGLFDAEVFSCRVGMVKPEPEIYRHALAQLQLTATDCVFVGDGGSNEFEGAGNVGLRTVFVSEVIGELWPDRIEQRTAAATYRIRQPPELLSLPIFSRTV